MVAEEEPRAGVRHDRRRRAGADAAGPRPRASRRRRAAASGSRRCWLVLAVVVVWIVVRGRLPGQGTRWSSAAPTRSASRTGSADRANDIVARRADNVVISITHGIADVLDAVIEWLQLLISTPAFPSPYPQIGFLGVARASRWFVTALVAGWRMSLLTGVVLRAVRAARLLRGQHGPADRHAASAVAFSVAIGLPLAVWMAHSSRARGRSSRRSST